MTTHRKPSAILRAIGERIRDPSRWTTGTSARDTTGESVASVSQDAVCWCWAGSYCREVPIELDGTIGAVVRSYMHRAIGTREVGNWNDTHTHAEVIAANARAVALAESEGQ